MRGKELKSLLVSSLCNAKDVTTNFVQTQAKKIKQFTASSISEKCIIFSLDRRITLWAAVVVVAIVAVIVGRASANALYTVAVDGSVVGLVQDASLPNKVVDRLAEEESIKIGAEVKNASKIQVQKFKAKQGETTPPVLGPDKLGDVLRSAVKFMAKGWVVSVEGKDVVALSTEEDARGVISDLRNNYTKAIVETGHATVEEVLIKEKIDIKEKEVPTSIFRNRQDAAKVLERGTDKTLTYVVQRGDSLWAIAQANNLTVEDLQKANPQVEGDLIREGDQLNLVVPNPYVTLTSKETFTYHQTIPYSVEVTYDGSMWPWQEKVLQYGQNGEKEIVEQVVRENGKEISRTRISEKVISYPVTQKILRGNKQVPAMGSGNMVWPVAGSISSYYGWRWGSFHQGVDIAADRGTPVRCADSGMVSYAGWYGGYGYLVTVDHGNGMETWYAHLSRIDVSVGQQVSRGEVIGAVGSTGNSTGPHLHFEVRVGGSPKNPLNYYK